MGPVTATWTKTHQIAEPPIIEKGGQTVLQNKYLQIIIIINGDACDDLKLNPNSANRRTQENAKHPNHRSMTPGTQKVARR